MGLIQDRRPRDWAYRVAFDRKDLPSLQEMARHIRETHDMDMIEDFNQKCEQKLRGGSAMLDNGIEIQDVTKTEDLVTTLGIRQCLNIIQGTSTVRWSKILASRHSAAFSPTVNDTTLNANSGGPYTLTLSTYGWSEARGMKLFFGSIGPPDNSTGAIINNSLITEMGVSNLNGDLLNHETFFNNAPSRAGAGPVFNAVFIFLCVIEFCPVV